MGKVGILEKTKRRPERSLGIPWESNPANCMYSEIRHGPQTPSDQVERDLSERGGRARTDSQWVASLLIVSMDQPAEVIRRSLIR